MAVPLYFDEKRYSYHVLAPHPPRFGDYQAADPTTAFEQQVQQLYSDAYALLKTQKFDGALDAFRQLHNLILTTVHPSLPPTSYGHPRWTAPLDPGLVDVLATKIGTVLQAQPLASYAFPKMVVADAGALPGGVTQNLAAFESSGLQLSPKQALVQASAARAAEAAAANDWAGAARSFQAALDAAPPDAQAVRAALTHDLALATEKSGGDSATSIKLAQSSADMFAAAKVFDGQAEALATLSGMQARVGDTVGAQKTATAATGVQNAHKLFPVQIAATHVTAAAVESAARAPFASAVVRPVGGVPVVPIVAEQPAVADAAVAVAPVAAPVAAADAAVLSAATAPRLMSETFLATMVPQRTFSLLGEKGTLALDLSGDVVKNVHGYLQSLSDSADLGLLVAGIGIEATQTVAYLPAMYFFTIPMAIGDCLAGLGNLEEAAASYAGVLVYPYINKAFEIPKLWSKLASVYLEMGDRDYRNAGDQAELWVTARTDYEHVVRTDGSLDAASPLYADARFAAIKARVTAFGAAGFPAKFNDNPDLLSKVQEARVKLHQIAAGLDFFGHKPDYLPPFGWEYLQNAAKYFAQQASQMEQRYIQYTASGEDQTLQRQQLDQQAQVAAQTVVLEQRGADEAQAAVDVANAGLNYANVQSSNAVAAQNDFAGARGALEQYGELEAWANAASVDQGSEVTLHIPSSYTYFNTSGERRSVVVQELERARTTLSQDLEANRLQRDADAAAAYAGEAQAQVADAQARVAIAQQRIALAQLQQQDAQENRDYLDTKELNARLWFDLARNARRISQRYTDMATAVALLAEKAYNAETGRDLHVIRFDYTHSATDNLMGADFLALDLDFFTYDYITTTKTKKAPVKRVISLADSFPVAFQQLRTKGSCSFQTEFAMFDRQTPGLYLCKLRNVEMVFVGITRASVAGTLRNVGASRFKQADGTVVTRFYPADVMPLSDFDLRTDALAFRVTPNDLQLFENHGIDTLWQLDMPLSANDIDFSAVLDVQLTLYYDGFFNPLLEDKVKQALPKSGTASRITSLRLTFPDELFYLRGRGEAELVFDAGLFPQTQTNLERKTSSLRVSGDAAAGAGLTLHVSSKALGRELVVKTDANGLVAGAVAADPLGALIGQPMFDTLTIVIKPEDNPQLVAGGKLNLSGIADLMLAAEYGFDYR
jgi:hypothetical protein